MNKGKAIPVEIMCGALVKLLLEKNIVTETEIERYVDAGQRWQAATQGPVDNPVPEGRHELTRREIDAMYPVLQAGIAKLRSDSEELGKTAEDSRVAWDALMNRMARK